MGSGKFKKNQEKGQLARKFSLKRECVTQASTLDTWVLDCPHSTSLGLVWEENEKL